MKYRNIKGLAALMAAYCVGGCTNQTEDENHESVSVPSIEQHVAQVEEPIMQNEQHQIDFFRLTDSIKVGRLEDTFYMREKSPRGLFESVSTPERYQLFLNGDLQTSVDGHQARVAYVTKMFLYDEAVARKEIERIREDASQMF